MSQDTSARTRLRERVAGALLRGDFTLSSGKKSSYYLDGKQITLHGAGLCELASVLLDMIGEDPIEAVGGLTLGADPIASAVAAFSALRARPGGPIHALIVRKEAKKHGTTRWLEGPTLRAGARVAAVDDVITTGAATIAAVERIREAGFVVQRAFCLVDREEGGREALAALGVRLEPVFSIREFL